MGGCRRRLLAAPTLIARAAGCRWRLFERGLPPHPWGMLVAGSASGLPVQWMCPSRTAPGGPAVVLWGARVAMRRRTITIADPQQWHRSFGRSLNAGGANDGTDGGAPAGQRTVAAGLRLKRSSARRWRCLQLGWSRPKLRGRRNPLRRTCCSTNGQDVRNFVRWYPLDRRVDPSREPALAA